MVKFKTSLHSIKISVVIFLQCHLVYAFVHSLLPLVIDPWDLIFDKWMFRLLVTAYLDKKLEHMHWHSQYFSSSAK